MACKTDKILDTNTISSVDLDRYNGNVSLIRKAWDSLPEDVDEIEREMFIEMASKVLTLSGLYRKEKDNKNLN